MTDEHEPTLRKPIGALAILSLIVIWCVVVVSLSATVNSWAWPLQAVFYLVAGTVWILPLRPLLLWMELGRWK